MYLRKTFAKIPLCPNLAPLKNRNTNETIHKYIPTVNRDYICGPSVPIFVEYVVHSIQETQREVGSILLKEAVLVVGRLTVSHNV